MSTSIFSSNPDKAWAEKFFLIYSPIWMLMVGIMMPTGWVNTWGDTAMLIHSLVVALPFFIIPLLIHKKYSDVPWTESYFLKANIFIAIFSFWGNYFGSEYFFDMLGMVYTYPNITTNLDSALVGSGEQKVPLIMYFLTHAYFMTYHATANIALRLVRRALANTPAIASSLMFIIAVVVVSYCWAWAETAAMANPMMAGTFYYEKMDLMLKYGSLCYATFFMASFPIYYFIDETPDRKWSLWETTAAALAAGALAHFLIDFVAHWIGNL
jgi:cycloeucalenol cycloisomerase